MGARSTIAAGLVGLILSAGLVGCGGLAGDLGGSESGVAVDLAASPAPGMRFAYRVRTTATISGAGVRELAESQKSASTVQRYVVEVTAATVDSFDVRVTGESLQETVVARFGRDWTPLKFGVEREGQYEDADLSTFPVLGEAFQAARDLSGHWTVGEARPWERTMTIPPLLSVRMRGTSTLKRITRLDGRRAAEFDYVASGEGSYGLSRLQMKVSGQHWVDLATGFPLAAKTSAPGSFMQEGEAVQMELKEERTLSRSESAGL